jgi:hypothetical protein
MMKEGTVLANDSKTLYTVKKTKIAKTAAAPTGYCPD